MTIRFVDELPRSSSGVPQIRSKWWRVAEELKTHPEQWAEVKTAPTHGHLSEARDRLRKYGCQTAARKVADDRVILYARWPHPES